VSSFLLRIMFTGLIAFVRTDSGHELTILLLNANHQHISDGTVLSAHKPLLLARGGGCTGTCPTSDSDIAQFVFADQSSGTAVASLEDAVTGGGAWDLTGSNLSIQKGDSGDPDLPALAFIDNTRPVASGVPAIIPTSSSERSDVSWLADMNQICPTCTLDASAVSASVPNATVVAKLHLRSGNVFTYSIARVGTNVTPVHFQRLDETGDVSSYSQAIATWMGADIEVSGDSIEIVDDSGDGRSMTLTPDENGKVEVAVLNLPPFVPPVTANDGTPEVGKHFEAFYNLVESPPATNTRLVPFAGAAPDAPSYSTVSWSSIHPSGSLGSDLLNAIRLNIGRTAYDRILCPPGGF
jgi:hypothetical protein